MSHHWYVEYLDWTTTEDDYERGEFGKGQCILFEKEVGLYSSFEAMKKGLCERFSLPENPDCWAVMATESGRIDVQFHVNSENIQPSEREIKDWKHGKCRLWNAYVVISVLRGSLSKPRAETLARLGKLQTV